MITDDKINKLLAEVAGVDVEEVDSDDCPLSLWVVEYDKLRLKQQWTPLTDHNQMASVEAGLVKRGIGYSISVSGYPAEWVNVSIYAHPVVYQGFHDFNKLRAFAQAIVKMKEGE